MAISGIKGTDYNPIARNEKTRSNTAGTTQNPAQRAADWLQKVGLPMYHATGGTEPRKSWLQKAEAGLPFSGASDSTKPPWLLPKFDPDQSKLDAQDTQKGCKFRPRQSSFPETQPPEQRLSAAKEMGARGRGIQQIMQLLMTFMQLIRQLLSMGGGEKGGPANKPAPGRPPKPGRPASGKGGGRNGGIPPELNRYKKDIAAASRITGIPANIISAMIWQESRGNAQAGSTNASGLTDSGLMQVNPNTFNLLSREHPELQGRPVGNPATNILAGAFYLKDQMAKFGSLPYALRAYNSGPNGVVAGNPNATKGTGDPSYVINVMNLANIITLNQKLPA